MVAYAAMISLRQILVSILHPAAGGRRISHNRAQLKSLHEKVNFLLEFLENYPSLYGKELDDLETKIRDAAYFAEDVIESDISNQLLAETETVSFHIFPRFPFVSLFILVLKRELFYVALQKVIVLWIQILIPVMCIIPISLQSLLPISYQNVIFVISRVLIPLFVHILVPFLILSVMAAGAGYVTHTAVLKGISLAARYWLYVSQPENQDLRCAIDYISSIIEEVIKIKEACSDSGHSVKDSTDGLSRQDFEDIGRNVVVGLDDDLKEISERLLGYPSELEVVSIVGMGGIGKTTLARKVYDDIKGYNRFDTSAWVTVSQEYSLRRVMLGLLDSAKIGAQEILKNHKECDGDLDQKLGRHLYQNLIGRRYLIVMDDLWDTKIWDFVRIFFPDNNNGSRVLLTTRLSEVASYSNPSNPPLEMRLMNDGDSWNLLCEKVFGGEGCPPELEAIGKTIARNCRGLPLALVVVGGLLYNEPRTVRDWTGTSKNLNSILSKDDEQCLEILGLSYNHLPHRLKPCFLYMGAFREDEEIHVTRLFNLWAAEGFLEASKSKSLEEVAEDYLKDLVQRSLVLVGNWSCNGNIKTCKIHDLLRQVCLLNAEKENFLDFANQDGKIGHGGAKNRRRLSTHVLAVLRASDDPRSSYSMARSFIYFGRSNHNPPHFYLGFRLLRVLDLLTETFYRCPNEITKLVHLRYLGFTNNCPLPQSISRLWNLQTIVYYVRAFGKARRIPVEIWSMPNLRYVYFMNKKLLPDPSACHLLGNSTVLENLHTLVGILEFRCTKGILKSVPNLKKLSIFYYRRRRPVDWSEYQLDSIAQLRQLENLKITVKYRLSISSVSKLAFPEKLKKLTLSGCRIAWESMRIVGALPNLQVLKLRNYACEGRIWEPVEGEFCQLKFLLLEESDLEHWRSNETHFPRLRCLTLRRCDKLNVVPSGMGEIPTLERMELVDCLPSAVASAQQIQLEQQDMGNEGLKIHIEGTYFDRQMWL